jgi:tRNA-specific 2-thiouridylase
LGPDARSTPSSIFSDAENISEGVAPPRATQAIATRGLLLQAFDKNKDQTYFLYRVAGEAMGRTLFPIGEFDKPTVRKMAEERGLLTAAKKDSQGICFVGQVGIRDFLSLYVDQKPGNFIDKISGKVLGQHDGAIFYTLGQRHGMDLGGGLPYYVVGKNMEKNEVYVTTNLNDDTLWKKTIRLASVHWINDKPADGCYQIRSRHRAPLVNANLKSENDEVILELDTPQRAIAAGQSVVIYDGDVCLGGGIII